MILRTATEHLSRNVVIKRRLPARVGGEQIYVSPDASLKLWRRNLEKTDPSLFNWAQEFVKEGDVVWDIGANVGLFAFSAASLAGPTGFVRAIEPDPWLAELLRLSARLISSKCAPVEVLQVAVSESKGIAGFKIAARGRSTNHLEQVEGSTQTGGARASVEVVTVPLDSLLEMSRPPQVMKIDVEGAEYEVLSGSQELLAKVRPLILCEVSSSNAARVGTLLRSYGYELFDLDAEKHLRRPVTRPTFNTLARYAPDKESPATF
ncbi:MAG TPA: FkbM family methyltransferase [Pyrinomonadaceae bacterium]|nr:FkbM family methyltransferase [Pyrinomonadaceae bacterium]